MGRVLQIRNRQRTRRVDGRRLRSITIFTLRHLLKLEEYILCVHLVDDAEMIHLNEQFLRHEGATDVITFDLRELMGAPGTGGELFVCVPEAVRQAARYQTTWQAEIVRYIVHGTLHLRGFDDLESNARRVMKREENRVMKALQKRFLAAEFLSITKPA